MNKQEIFGISLCLVSDYATEDYIGIEEISSCGRSPLPRFRAAYGATACGMEVLRRF